MMPFVMLFIGLLLIFLEFCLPGAVMGIAGIIMVVASMIAFASVAESGFAVVAYIIGVGIAIALIIRFAIRRIRSTASENTMYLEKDQTGFVASSFDTSLIGKEGIVTADLKPAGHIMVAGQQYQATTESGYLVRGTPVVVLGGMGAHLNVKPIKKEKSS